MKTLEELKTLADQKKIKIHNWLSKGDAIGQIIGEDSTGYIWRIKKGPEIIQEAKKPTSSFERAYAQLEKKIAYINIEKLILK